MFCRNSSKDLAKAAKIGRDDNENDDQRDENHQILHQGNHGGSAQPACIGVGRQDDEGDEQGQVDIQPAKRESERNTKRGKRDLNAEHLQSDVGHGCYNARKGYRESERSAAKTVFHEVGSGDIATLLTDGPELGHQNEDDGIDEDGIGNSEPAVQRAQAKHGRGYGDKGIGGVKIAAQQEPGHNSAETPPGKAPFADQIQVAAPPARSNKSQNGNERKENDKDGKCNPVKHGLTSLVTTLSKTCICACSRCEPRNRDAVSGPQKI